MNENKENEEEDFKNSNSDLENKDSDSLNSPIDEEQEKMDLLMQADNIKGQHLSIDSSGELFTEDEIRNFILSGVHDPSKMHEVYYKGIDKLLRNFLPKGSDNKKVRDIIYEEKNCFLTRGHRIKPDGTRGADGRMGYIEDAEIILNVIIDSVVHKRTYFELYYNLRNLNVSRGYGVSDIEK